MATQKKRSAATSQIQKFQAKPGLRIFDLNGVKVIGHILEQNGNGVLLRYPSILDLKLNAIAGGETLEIKAKLSPVAPYVDEYFVRAVAIRGEAILTDDVYITMYAEFSQRAKAGEYRHFKPGVGVEATIVVGDGKSVAPEGTVATLSTKMPLAAVPELKS